jgi:hypothetical protein
MISKVSHINPPCKPKDFPNREKLYDFLPEILKTSPKDISILITWMDYFQANQVPFMVVDYDTHYVLFKHRIV